VAGWSVDSQFVCRAASIQQAISWDRTYPAPRSFCIQSDDNGISGQSVIHLFRLLQSAALKHALAKHNADIAFIASEYVYQEILQYEYDNAVYEPVDVQMKETITRAWLRVFGTAAAQREALNGRNCWPSAN
jgi:hypothetical protein